MGSSTLYALGCFTGIVQVIFKQHLLPFGFINAFNPQLQYLIQPSSASPLLLPACLWVHLPHDCFYQPPFLRKLEAAAFPSSLE